MNLINKRRGAIDSLTDNKAKYSMIGDSIDIWASSDIEQPTEVKIEAEVIRLQAEYDTLAYARSRQAEYPDWGVQLEKIDDDGLTRWREEMIDPIKSKWPKDNSGPK